LKNQKSKLRNNLYIVEIFCKNFNSKIFHFDFSILNL